MAWPPTLVELKGDMGIDPDDTRDDVKLQRALSAAVTFVERIHPDLDWPNPTDDLELGTLRLAARWDARRRSPDALIQLAELGASRVPSFDPDIDRLLRIGRHQKPRIG